MYIQPQSLLFLLREKAACQQNDTLVQIYKAECIHHDTPSLISVQKLQASPPKEK